MKTLFIVSATILFALQSVGQTHHYDAYKLKRIKLCRIKEWKIQIDSFGNRTDSSVTILLYDSLGRVTEKEFDFNKDNSLHVSVRYLYNKKGFLIDSIYESPYAVESSSLYDRLDSTDVSIYEWGRLKTRIQTWRNKKIVETVYNYGDLYLKNNRERIFLTPFERWQKFRGSTTLFTPGCRRCVKDETGNIYENLYEDIIDFIEIKTNGSLTSLVRFEYEFCK